MKVKVSNTGKGVTLTFAKDAISFDRIFLDYNARCIRITPNEAGNKISGSAPNSMSITKQAKQYPDWPLHGLIELEFQCYEDPQGDFFEAVLPTTLPPARPISRQSELPLPASQGNVTIHLMSKAYNFQVPDSELLVQVLDWAKKGHLVA